VQIVVIPREPTVDDGETVVDVFTLGINFSHLVRALREMDTPEGFIGEGWGSSFRRANGEISFQLGYQHDATRTFKTKLSKADSGELVELVERTVRGEKLHRIPAEVGLLATPKSGRNDPCPCGSGKKYKKCCGLTEKATGLPFELELFRSVKELSVRNLLTPASQQLINRL
jgi:SEC-C motif